MEPFCIILTVNSELACIQYIGLLIFLDLVPAAANEVHITTEQGTDYYT